MSAEIDGHAAEPRVTFVVVNWNQKQLTLDCLESLYAQNYANFGVVLVDNGSGDGSEQAVRDAFPGVALLQSGSNVGIAAGNNLGIKKALSLGTDYVFLLNNDTVVDPDMLGQLIRVSESDVAIGIVAPLMLVYDSPDTVWCAGASLNPESGSTTRHLAGASQSAVDPMQLREVSFSPTCAVCIKQRLFASVDLMDERFFIYYDDTDWFARVINLGLRVVFVPQAKMWHRVSATTGPTSPVTDYYMVRNQYLYVSKHARSVRRMALIAQLSARNLLAIAAYTVKPHDGARRPHRNARLLALRDAALGRWGKMGPDVEAVCRRAAG